MDIKSGFRLNEIQRNANSVKEETKEEIKEVTIPELINETVTEADVVRVVKKYAELKNQNKQIQAFTMLSGQLVKYNEPIITILLDNDAQQHTYNEIRQEFLDYVRTELKNNLIQIESDERKDALIKKALSPGEKFAIMATKNPLLVEFRKRLDLDPTF